MREVNVKQGVFDLSYQGYLNIAYHDSSDSGAIKQVIKQR